MPQHFDSQQQDESSLWNNSATEGNEAARQKKCLSFSYSMDQGPPNGRLEQLTKRS